MQKLPTTQIKMKHISLIFILFSIGIVSCVDSNLPDKLPYIGQHSYTDGDTILYQIPAFEFIDQDEETINNLSFKDHIYISDFFFTTCPSICPKVKKQMLRIYDKYENNDIIKMVSHTLDPKRDTPEILKLYSENLGVDTKKWMFLTGDKDELRELALKYFVAVVEDDEAPGGLDHSGKIVVVDKEGHVRAFAEGTDPDDVTVLMKEIDILINEYNSED